MGLFLLIILKNLKYKIYELDETMINDNYDFSQTISVMKKICNEMSQEDFLRTTYFFTYTKILNDFYKVIIDSGSSVNAISERALKQLGLPHEKHPSPYEVSWVVNSSLPVNKRCLLNIKVLSYEDQVWLDVVPLDIGSRDGQRPTECRKTGPNRDRRSRKMGQTGLRPVSVRSL